MSAVTIFVIFALGCLHVTGANEQLSLTDFLLDFLLSLWVPLNYVPSQQVLSVPDQAKREQLISIEKSKIALNNYINHLLRYAEENGGLNNGQITDTGDFVFDPNLLFPDNGQPDGQESPPSSVPPSGPSIYLPPSGSPNIINPTVDPDFLPPNCKPTSYNCDNPIPNQNGHFHPAHDHPLEFHPTHYHQNQLHPGHYHQPFFHPGHFHKHHTLPIGIDGNDLPTSPDNYPGISGITGIPVISGVSGISGIQGVSGIPAVSGIPEISGNPEPNVPPTGAYPVPSSGLDPSVFSSVPNCDPLDPSLMFNPTLCADILLPYYAKYLQPTYLQPPYPQITNQDPLYQTYYPLQTTNQQPSNGQQMMFGTRKQFNFLPETDIRGGPQRKRSPHGIYKNQLNSLAKRIIYLIQEKNKQQIKSRNAEMYNNVKSKTVSTRDLGSVKEKVKEEEKIEATESDSDGSRIFEDWYIPNFVDDLLRNSYEHSPSAPLYDYSSQNYNDNYNNYRNSLIGNRIKVLKALQKIIR